jgi:hypothetical protein
VKLSQIVLFVLHGICSARWISAVHGETEGGRAGIPRGVKGERREKDREVVWPKY